MLTSSIRRVQLQGNGSTVNFPFPYLVYSASDMLVIVTDPTTGLDTLQVLNTDYTIDPADLGNDGGITVVFVTAPVNNSRVTLARQVSYVQTLSLVTGAALPAKPVEKQLDLAEMALQQISDAVSLGGLPLSTPVGQTPQVRSPDAFPYDTSSGTVAQISVTPFNIKDQTGGVTIIPTINNVTIDTMPAPKLVVADSDTKLYLHCKVDSTSGALQETNELLSGTSVPDDTSTDTYKLVSNFVVNNASGIRSVLPTGGGITGSQNYFYCGALPATDGSGHLWNS